MTVKNIFFTGTILKLKNQHTLLLKFSENSRIYFPLYLFIRDVFAALLKTRPVNVCEASRGPCAELVEASLLPFGRQALSLSLSLSLSLCKHYVCRCLYTDFRFKIALISSFYFCKKQSHKEQFRYPDIA